MIFVDCRETGDDLWSSDDGKSIKVKVNAFFFLMSLLLCKKKIWTYKVGFDEVRQEQDKKNIAF